MGDDLVEARIDEAQELDLRDRLQSIRGHSDRGTDDPRLGEGCVDHPVVAELLVKVLRRPEDAAVLADVLAHHQNVLVAL